MVKYDKVQHIKSQQQTTAAEFHAGRINLYVIFSVLLSSFNGIKHIFIPPAVYINTDAINSENAD